MKVVVFASLLSSLLGLAVAVSVSSEVTDTTRKRNNHGQFSSRGIYVSGESQDRESGSPKTSMMRKEVNDLHVNDLLQPEERASSLLELPLDAPPTGTLTYPGEGGDQVVAVGHAAGTMTVEQQNALGLPRRRRRVDCTYTDWEPWQACSVLCGAGIRQRDRQTVGPDAGGIRCTDMVTEYEDCNLQDCAVACEWNHWGAWGPCSLTCGGGNRDRQRAALPFTNLAGGAECPVEGKRKTGICNAFHCPVSCVYEAWGLWGGCSKTCDSGLKRRSREPVGPYHGGAPCEGPPFADEQCNAFACPVDCLWNTWGGYGECSKPCGGGSKLRERQMAAQAQNGGASCLGSPAEVLTCNVEDCPRDCEWTEWHDPSPCTKTCGGGAFKRHRAKIAFELNGGAPCVGPKTQMGPCNVEPCAIDCKYDEWQPWSECTNSCGGGVHSTTRNYTEPTYGGLECSDSNTTKEEECNMHECAVMTVEVNGGGGAMSWLR